MLVGEEGEIAKVAMRQVRARGWRRRLCLMSWEWIRVSSLVFLLSCRSERHGWAEVRGFLELRGLKLAGV